MSSVVQPRGDESPENVDTLGAASIDTRGMRPIRFAVLALFLLCSAGCDFTRLTANTTAGLFRRAAPAFDQHWDYQLAGEAAPGSILQLEGIYRIVPDNEELLIELAHAYTGYTYGWIEDEMEVVEQTDLDRYDALRARARLFYTRARNFGFARMRLEEEDFDEARRKPPDEFAAWLADRFEDPEDAEPLFWTGYSWGSMINVSLDDPEAMADLANVKELIKRSVELDPTYYNASGLAFLGYAECAFPAALGGDPDAGRLFFERALRVTSRKAHLIQVNYARSCAVQTQNRELFVELLNEVINAGDQGNDVRMANKIARRRAARYLQNVDMLF